MNADQVVRVAATKGPVLPVQVVKELGGSTMLAGALLSQLVYQKRLRVSNLKIGGSPLYYVKGQEHKLQDYYKYLNEKDKKTFDLLKQKKILKDSEQEPLVRVSLRNIKDFAIPLEVTFDQEKEIFWKWYLLNEDDARDMIRDYLKVGEKESAQNRLKEGEEIKKIEENKKPEIEKHLQDFSPSDTVRYEEGKKEESKERGEQEQEDAPEDKEIGEWGARDAFGKKIINFLKNKGIIIKNFEVKRKNSDADLHLVIPSAVGEMEYYCKAKNKKKVNDSDVSSAYVQGQLKKLPAILLTTGDLTKKAKELISKEIKISILKM